MNTNSGKVALVTGAGKRIGRVIALEMAAQGWDVALHFNASAVEAEATAQAIRALGRRACIVQCELRDARAVRALLPAVHERLGAVRCIVNNASLFQEDSVHAADEALFHDQMQANLLAPILLAQALHASLADGEQGCVINLLDQKLYNLNPDFLSYTLSKAALQTATIMLAQGLAPRLRVVGVAPGLTMVSGEQTDEGFAKAHAMTPLGRSSTPEDVARAVCFAAESPAITGTTLVVDGGQHLLPLPRDVMFLAK